MSIQQDVTEKILAEEKIKIEQERTSTIFNHQESAVIISNKTSGIIEANQSFKSSKKSILVYVSCSRLRKDILNRVHLSVTGLKLFLKTPTRSIAHAFLIRWVKYVPSEFIHAILTLMV
jgi:hypothetical protein